MKDILIFVLMALVFVAGSALYPNNFCVLSTETEIVFYPASDFFSEERLPAIRHHGVLYPFDDNPYFPQPYVAVERGIGRWAASCQEK